VGCITSTISLHDHPDGDFAPYSDLAGAAGPGAAGVIAAGAVLEHACEAARD
jgi:hypothetical protein